MTVYALAQLSIHDRERYDRYVSRFMGVLAAFDGQLLAADESPEVLEGSWDGDKVVLICFPSRAELERWASSPEYTEIAQDRIAATSGSVLLVSGVDVERAGEAGSRPHLPATAALADAVLTLGGQPRVVPGLTPTVRGVRVAGPCVPAIHRGSVDAILAALDDVEPGAVLVVDDGGRTDRACVGDLVALEAKAAGVAAIVVWGCHRDTEQLASVGLPLFSLGRHPAGPTPGDPIDAARPVDGPARIGDDVVTATDHVVADDDGVILIPGDDFADTSAEALHIEHREGIQADRVRTGESLRSQLRFEEYLARRAQDPSFDFRAHLRLIGGEIER